MDVNKSPLWEHIKGFIKMGPSMYIQAIHDRCDKSEALTMGVLESRKA